MSHSKDECILGSMFWSPIYGTCRMLFTIFGLLKDANVTASQNRRSPFVHPNTIRLVLRWILEILHDPDYFVPWELWDCSILRSCRILVSTVGTSQNAVLHIPLRVERLGVLNVGLRLLSRVELEIRACNVYFLKVSNICESF